MNTIHVIMDTLKRDHIGCYGSAAVKTPNLDRFAQRSVVFDQAFCASFPCMPARRDFVTGNYEFPFRGWGPLEEWDKPIAGQLSSRDVTTGLVTDHYHLLRDGSGNYHWRYDCWRFIRGMEGDKAYSDPEAGLDIDYRCDPARLSAKHRKYYYKYKHFNMKEEKDWPAARTFLESADWVTRNRGHEKGFHLQIDSFPPHEPFDPPPGYAEMYDPEYEGDRITTPVYRPWRDHYSEREIQNIRALYAGTVTYVDRWFGEFMNRVEELGLLENTVVVVTTDHGTYTGDHGWTGKLGTYMYDCVCHIPMMVYCPGVEPRRDSAIVQNVDVAPTMLDAAGVEPVEPMHGRSLLPIVRGEQTTIREYAHSGYFGRNHIVNDGRYAYHLWHLRERELYWHGLTNSYFVGAGPLGPVEPEQRRRVELAGECAGEGRKLPPALFDLEDDPGQENNIAEANPKIVKRFDDEIRRWCDEVNAPKEYVKRLFGD